MAGREGTHFGPYLLTRRLGGGAAGEVYLGEGGPGSPGDSASRAGQVAVKVLAGSDADVAAREIARQAELAGTLKQPHIIPFHGILAQDGALGVAMAFAPGGSLGDALAGRGFTRVALPLPIPVAARVTVQIAQALDAAHAAGLVHGDLKPSNVFVRTSPSGKPLTVLSDFGQGVLMQSAVTLAAQGDATDPRRQSWADAQLLSAAPEVAQGGAAYPASDQYALATLAYLLLVGEPPITGSGAALLSAIVSQPVAAPSRRYTSLPASLDAILLRALAKDPAQRYPSVGTFAAALDDALAVPTSATVQRSGVTAGMARLSGAHPTVLTSSPAASSPGVSSSRSRSPASVSGASLAVGADLPIPAVDTSPGVNRRLAIITGSAILLVVLSCALVLRAFTGGVILPQIQLGGGFVSARATSTPRSNATATAAANDAQSHLRAATNGAPQFSDALSSNGNHWQTSANALFFGKDGYHLANSKPTVALTVDMPGAMPSYSTLAVRCDIVVAKGALNDFVGLRAYIDSAGDYYAFTISAEGKYEAWQYVRGSWTLLLDGFIGNYNVGIGQKNTVDVLIDSQDLASPQAWFFVNGAFVNTIALDPQGPFSGGAGLIVKDAGVEAVYSNFAVYGSGS